MSAKVALYSAVGEELTHYEVDVAGANLLRRKTVKVAANVQYAWPHPSRQYLYVATSNRGGGLKADSNHISAFRIDKPSGALTPHGEPQPLRARAVHLCVDARGRYILSAHNLPSSGISVNRINSNGTIGPEVKQPETLDFGIYPHQVMMTGQMAILVDRGNDAADGKPEDPGALKLFRFDAGILSTLASIAPNGGYGFGPRHLDFHPTHPWVYVSLERQSRLYTYRMSGDTLEHDAAYICDTLADRENIKPRQHAGAIHVHPNGRCVYVINRADWTVNCEGKAVFAGGENSIVVYSIDISTGKPTPIQHVDPRCIHVRTFAINRSGRLLVAASIKPIDVRVENRISTVPAALSVFRIVSDGKLEFVRKYDVDTAGAIHYWMGMVELE